MKNKIIIIFTNLAIIIAAFLLKLKYADLHTLITKMHAEREVDNLIQEISIAANYYDKISILLSIIAILFAYIIFKNKILVERVGKLLFVLGVITLLFTLVRF